MTLNKNNFYFFLIIFFSLFFNYFGYDEGWIYYVTKNIYYHASDNDFSNIPFSSLVGKSYMWVVRSLSLLNYFADFFFKQVLFFFFNYFLIYNYL